MMARRRANKVTFKVEALANGRWRVTVFIGGEKRGEGVRITRERAERLGEQWVRQQG
jgi:hypothetical protein